MECHFRQRAQDLPWPTYIHVYTCNMSKKTCAKHTHIQTRIQTPYRESFSGDGSRLVVADLCVLCIYPQYEWTHTRKTHTHTHTHTHMQTPYGVSVSFSPDGSVLAVADLCVCIYPQYEWTHTRKTHTRTNTHVDTIWSVILTRWLKTSRDRLMYMYIPTIWVNTHTQNTHTHAHTCRHHTECRFRQTAQDLPWPTMPITLSGKIKKNQFKKNYVSHVIQCGTGFFCQNKLQRDNAGMVCKENSNM